MRLERMIQRASRQKAYGDAHRNGQYASVEGAKGRETAVSVAAA